MPNQIRHLFTLGDVPRCEKLVSTTNRVTCTRIQLNRQESVTLNCKDTLRSNVTPSPNISSSQTHNRLLHLHAAPSSQPRADISDTKQYLWTASSNKRLKRTPKGTPPNHGSCQKKVLAPSPTFRETHYWNHLPLTPLTPSLILATSRHQEESFRPPTSPPPHHTSQLRPYTKNSSSPLINTNTTFLTKHN